MTALTPTKPATLSAREIRVYYEAFERALETEEWDEFQFLTDGRFDDCHSIDECASAIRADLLKAETRELEVWKAGCKDWERT